MEAAGTGSVFQTWATYYCPGAPIKIDSRGHVVVAATAFSNPVNLEGLGTPFITTPVGSNDCVLASYFPDGTVEWGFVLGSTTFDAPMGINLDKDDNIYIWGYFTDPITRDPGIGSVVLTTTDGNQDIFVAKYDKDGNLLKHMQLIYTYDGASAEFIYNVETDSKGNLLMGGEYNHGIDLDPSATVYTLPASGPGSTSKPFVARYDASFNFDTAWAYVPVSGPLQLLDFKVASDDGFLFGGLLGDTTDFDLGLGIHYEKGNTGFVARYDSTGAFKWVARLHNDWHSHIHRIALTENDDVIVGGWFSGDQTAWYGPSGDSIVFSSWTGGYWDLHYFLAELDTDGYVKWARDIPAEGTSNYFNTLSVDTLNHKVFLSTSFTDLLNFDFGGTNYTITGPSLPHYTKAIAIYDEPTGNYNGAWKVNTNTGSTFNYHDVRDGYLYTFGTYKSNIDLDLSAGTDNISTTNAISVYLAKYDPFPVTTSNADTIQEATDENDLYPVSNLLSDEIQIKGSSSNEFQYDLYSIDGSYIKGGTIRSGNSINCSALSAGVYLLRIGNRTFKLVRS